MYEEYTKYAIDVIENKILAGELIKLSCQRFLDYFENHNYYFDPTAVEKVIDFCNHLVCSTGKFANKPFRLTEWQKFIISYLYGFKRKTDNTRMVRQAYIQLARKSGKTALASALSLYHLIADGEANAQVVFAANSSKQATLAFNMANDYCRKLDPKGKHFKRYRDSIKFQKTNSIIEVVSADASKLDGKNCSFIVLDEYHEAPNNQVRDVLWSSTTMRTQPLMVMITSAGFDLTKPCYEYRCNCIDLLNGKYEDDSTAAFIFELDTNDDYTTEDCWIKAQPNINFTVNKETIREELKRCRSNSDLVNFRTKTLNMWCSSSVGEWIEKDLVNKCLKKDLDYRKFPNCVIGIDLSSVSDISAISIMYYDHENKHFYCHNEYFLPQSALIGNKNSDFYNRMYNKGFLHITNGNIIDYDFIYKRILEIQKEVQIESIVYDPWNSTQFIIKLNESGFTCIPYSQTIGSLSRPTKELEYSVKTENITFSNNPITSWMFSNVILKTDENENIRITKQYKSSMKKIDGIASCINALGYYLTTPQYNNEIFTI